jgi:D-alanyl-D-alanine carboxypeptidase
MTAYLTLKRYPLIGAQDGFTVTVTTAQAQAETQDAALDQSVAPVQAGEQLTERQMLEALLIPSGNNIAQMLAARVAGSEKGFVAEMNTEAHALGMDQWQPPKPSAAARPPAPGEMTTTNTLPGHNRFVGNEDRLRRGPGGCSSFRAV